MYKILVDENIPFAREAFSGFGEVKLKAGRDISNTILKNIDILIIRSVTKVDKSLLENTPVRFVGTTTIGLDHLDTPYLENNEIAFANSPGCNANSVAEYITAGLLKIAIDQKFELKEKSIGIIGYGNIGSKVARITRCFGMMTIINDPPLQRNSGQSFFTSYSEALKADIITFHVPLNMEGTDKTYHMLSDSQLQNFSSDKIILNSSRGSVLSDVDLKKFLLKKKNTVVLDVWENEPDIDTDLLNLVKIGSPHIAGYSYEGKVNGTIMIYEALCKYLNITPNWQPKFPVISDSIVDYNKMSTLEESLDKIISNIYNIEYDDINFRKIFGLNKNERGYYFDRLRKSYPVRREFSNYSIRIKPNLKREIDILKALRFKIIEI